MNRKQRDLNRMNAVKLSAMFRAKRVASHTCEKCGKPGVHWVGMPQSLEDIVAGRPQNGFWICNEENL